MAISPVRNEYRRRGYAVTISVGALTAGSMRQYERDSVYLKSGRREFGIYNVISVINLSEATIYIDLDFSPDKRIIIPAGTIITKDNVSFNEFNVINPSSATDINDDEVFITAGFEFPLLRDNRPAAGARIGGI